MNPAFPRELRKNASKAEAALWYFLRNRRCEGLRFRRQHLMGRYIVDFVCLEKKLIIEVDGGQHALRRDYDERRTCWLMRQGYKVIRFWNNDVLGNAEGVMESIYRELKR